MQDSHLSIEQDVTEVPDDIRQFDDLFPAFLKLGCYTVAFTDVPAHLWHIQVLKEITTSSTVLTTGEQRLLSYLYSHVVRLARCS